MKKICFRRPVSKIMAMGLFACFSLTPLSALAEVKGGSFEITPFGGFNFFEKKQNLENSPIYGGRLGYNFTKHFGVETTVEFINSHVDNKTKTGSGQGEYRSPMDSVDLAFYHIDAVYHFMPEGSFTPFIVAGVGGAHYDPKISNRDLTAVNLGVGAKFWMTDHVALRVDLRDNMVIDETYHNLNATAGLVFAFGGKSSSEPAPVVKAAPPVVKAAPPVVPAPAPVVKAVPVPLVVAKDTTAPTVTLVNPFNGSVDVPLLRQVRVSFSEAIDPATISSNTFVLYQGDTPVPGKVAAPTDQTASFTQVNEFTPNTVYNGKVTTGVKDLAGNLLEKEFVWSFKTAPTPVPVVITKTETKVKTKTVIVNKFVMLTGAHFAFDSAALTPAGKDLIKQNIKIMKDNPEIRVQIQGHTSAAGSEKYNHGLSERRAKSVKDFVIKDGGVAPARLETIGYGETRPAMKEVNPRNHGSKEAKANMRVLFEIIDN